MTKTAMEYYADITEARQAAIRRIETAMSPGSDALSSARRPGDGHHTDRRHDADGGATLYWRVYGSSSGPAVSVPVDATPEYLQRLYTVACDQTAQLVRECEARLAETAALAASTIAAYERVGRNTLH